MLSSRKMNSDRTVRYGGEIPSTSNLHLPIINVNNDPVLRKIDRMHAIDKGSEAEDHLSLCLIDTMTSKVLAAASNCRPLLLMKQGHLLKNYLQPVSASMLFNWLFIHRYSSLAQKRLVRIDRVRFLYIYPNVDFQCVVFPFDQGRELLLFSAESPYINGTNSMSSMVLSDEWQQVHITNNRQETCEVVICMKNNYDRVLWSSSRPTKFTDWLRSDQLPLFQQTFEQACQLSNNHRSQSEFYKCFVVDKWNETKLVHFLPVQDAVICHVQVIRGQMPHSPAALSGPLRTRQKDEALIAKANLSTMFQ